MVSKLRRVVIDLEAKKSLRDAYLYIKKDSLVNADKIRSKILSTIKDLAHYPERHGPDKYRKENYDGLYRAYEVSSYRITYYVSDEEIRVIRIRHTKMNPLEY